MASHGRGPQKNKFWQKKYTDDGAGNESFDSSDEEMYLRSGKPDTMGDLHFGPVDESVWQETKVRCG